MIKRFLKGFTELCVVCMKFALFYERHMLLRIADSVKVEKTSKRMNYYCYFHFTTSEGESRNNKKRFHTPKFIFCLNTFVRVI